jgi:hypothetical protein
MASAVSACRTVSGSPVQLPACAISANANAYCHEDGVMDASSAATWTSSTSTNPAPVVVRSIIRRTSSSLARSGSATRSVTSGSASTAASSSKSAPTAFCGLPEAPQQVSDALRRLLESLPQLHCSPHQVEHLDDPRASPARSQLRSDHS